MVAVLPGHKFSVWTGWITALILTPNPITFPKFRALNRPYTISVISLTLFMFFFAADLTLNIFPSNILQPKEKNQITVNLIRGFVLYHTCMLVVFRLYFLLRSTKISILLRSIGNYWDIPLKTAVGGELFRTIEFMGLFICITWEAIALAIALSTMDKRTSWFDWLNNACYTTLTLCFGTWPAYMVRFVAFALVNTTLEKLLRMFESFCFRMEHALARIVDQEQRDARKVSSYEKLGCQLFLMEQNIHWKYFMNDFEEIQQLFKLYDEVFGPIISMLLASSTVGLIETVTELLKPRKVLSTHALHGVEWTSIMSHLIVLTILNTGYRARSRIEELKGTLKKKIRGSFALNGSDALGNWSKIVDDWDWKMSAAGFFVVDRSLISGIVSTMMTYVVLLLQFQDRKTVTSMET